MPDLTQPVCPEAHLASLAKPPDSLGTLEQWAALLSRLQGTLKPEVDPVSVLVFCADHGVKNADDAISPYPSSVTQAVFRALAAGISGTAVIARSSGAHLTVVDCGIAGDVASVTSSSSAIDVVHAKVAEGTADLRHGACMTEPQLERALGVGSDAVAAEASSRGARCVCVGEVGIGNTTSAAALLAALTGSLPADCCGRGTGLDDAGLAHKVATVQAALDFHGEALEAAAASEERPSDVAAPPHASPRASPRAPPRATPRATPRASKEALRRLGGLELAAMVGAFHEAHRRRIPVLVDGFISAVAALCAVRMKPSCREAMLFATALEEEPSSARGGEILGEALGAQVRLQLAVTRGGYMWRLHEALGAQVRRRGTARRLTSGDAYTRSRWLH